MKKLTKAEEDIMQVFWAIGPATVSRVIAELGSPKPPHSTISSIVRILEGKGFLDHKAYGRTYEYRPIVDKRDYTRLTLKKLVKGYFDGSVNNLVSFLVEENDLSIKDIARLVDQNNQPDK